MIRENTSKITLLISLAIHTVALVILPLFKNIPQKKELTNLIVTYRQTTSQTNKQNKYQIPKELSVKQKELPNASLPKEIDKPKIEQSPIKFDFAKLFKPKETISLAKLQPLPQTSNVSKKISLKDIPVEPSKDPIFLDYRDKITKKIEEKVYYYSDKYSYFENPIKGKIVIAFTIISDGRLKNLSLIEEKSSKDSLLRKIVLDAVNNAPPFDKFPKDLNYSERPFKQEVDFQCNYGSTELIEN